MRKSWKFQLSFSLGLLILTELLYRLWPVGGFSQPFVPDNNFGAWLDMVLMGKLSNGHWVAVNALPTAAHTIWGVLAGQLLLSDKRVKKETTNSGNCRYSRIGDRVRFKSNYSNN